jgi:hypothetical protein
MDMWHGKVTDGLTLVACLVAAPRASRAAIDGQRAGEMASGRKPSMRTKITDVIS